MNDLRFEFPLINPDDVLSPALMVDPDRIARNIRTMIEIVGGVDQIERLRPHVKTHKMPEVVEMQVAAGVTKFKAATLREAEMVADSGGQDVVLAYQPVGPGAKRFAHLVKHFPDTTFSAVVDDPNIVALLSRLHGDSTQPLTLFIDVDCGMHRTGIELGAGLDALRTQIEADPHLEFGGLHVYDGHIHDPQLNTRTDAARAIIEKIAAYDQQNASPNIIGGGSPTFAIWANETAWQCSPGTPLLWDWGYGASHPDLDFSVAAALLTRVVSRPGGNRLCLDLGHKAVASEMPLEQRALIPEIKDAVAVSHSEEHYVIETESAASIAVGQEFIAIPRHICPTVALHEFAIVVRDGRATGERWRVTARNRL